MICKNCAHSFKGKFCNQCGQHIRVKRLSFKSLFQELFEGIFRINSLLIYTIKNVFKRPGHTIRNYLNGQRKSYFKPIRFILTLSTLYFLVSKISDSDTFVNDFLAALLEPEEGWEGSPSSLPIINWFTKNYAYTTLLMVPVFSFASYVSFLGYKKNYLEHCVVNLYVTGAQALLYSFFLIVGTLTGKGDLFMAIAVITSKIFNFWSFIQFFHQRKKGFVISRLLLAYILFYILLTIILLVLTVPFLDF